ncbi:MAG TPA: sigma-70 family RNA polymerase sigma factor [Mycobacteriales bacterium]|nr:sigma-70 family RNA polymerase sigma factor [Mycobacteriales bacterium]
MTAEPRFGLEQGHVVLSLEEVGGGEPGYAGSHHRNPMSCHVSVSSVVEIRITRPAGCDPIWEERRIPRVLMDQIEGGAQVRVEGQEDAVLLRDVARGSEAALEIIYNRYGPACYRLARRILADGHLAEDVVQQVFLALWQGSGYDPSRGALSTWLLGITHHKAVDMVRHQERRRADRLGPAQAEIVAAGPEPDEVAWESLRAIQARDALRTLSGEHREVLLLAYYGGFTQSEIAEMTGLPLGTVKSRTLHAMRRLRATLASSLGDEGETR